MPVLFEAGVYCLNPDNPNLADNALDLLAELVKYKLSVKNIEEAIERITNLGNSQFIRDVTIDKILVFFEKMTENVKDLDYKKTIIYLEKKITSVKTTIPAKIIATIVSSKPDLYAAYISVKEKQLLGAGQEKLQAAIIVGEIGKRKDLSSLSNIVNKIDEMF